MVTSAPRARPARPAAYRGGMADVRDVRGRGLRDLRVSVTDRCNFRCRYCMPREVFGADHAFLPRAELLTFEELERIVRAAAAVGVHKVRLTGGEPLLRRGIAQLVARLAAVDGIDDLALTTNGSLLPALAEPLRTAGLHRVTVSLDSLDDATFRAVSDVTLPLARVMEGLDAARAAGFRVKLNTVVKRGVNDHELVDLAAYARAHGDTIRFIEYMDVGATNGWRLDDVVPAAEILARIDVAFPLEPIPPGVPGEVATRHRYRDGRGEIGVIASVTQPFCATCVRARLSAVGELYTCLFATRGHDLRALLRGGVDDTTLVARLAAIWGVRNDRYSELRTAGADGPPRVEMSYIGG